MSHCTYLFKDPKTSVWRYVGKGGATRPFDHFNEKYNTRLARMLRKRVAEGYEIAPVILQAKDDADAIEMEMLLISMLGREDLHTGTLFNLTDGGEGSCGRKVYQAEIDKRKLTFTRKSAEELALISSKIQAKRKRTTSSKEWKKFLAQRISDGKKKPCTIDGVHIFESREALIQALGQGKSGSRSKEFKYV